MAKVGLTKDAESEFGQDLYTERPVASAMSGCLYATFVIAVSGAMLLVNAMLCLSIYSAFPKSDDLQIAPRLGQLFFFVAPVLLMILEWNLLDRLQRMLSD